MLVQNHAQAGHGSPFPSDFFTALATANATVHLTFPDAPHSVKKPEEFHVLEIPKSRSYIIQYITFPLADHRENYIADTFKVALRAQNSHSFVNAGFIVKVTGDDRTIDSATVVFGGLDRIAVRATRTEDALVGKCFGKGAVPPVLVEELHEFVAGAKELDDEGIAKAYREDVALNLFGKFWSNKRDLQRPVSTSQQNDVVREYNNQAPESPLPAASLSEYRMMSSFAPSARSLCTMCPH